MNKTAVDFLAYELMNLDIAYEMGLEKNEFHKLRQEIIKKAKTMEKEQIIDFANGYGTYLLQGGQMSATTYNETFKSK